MGKVDNNKHVNKCTEHRIDLFKLNDSLHDQNICTK